MKMIYALALIAWLESRNEPFAINPNDPTPACGPYQMREIAVQEVNRIHGTSYVLADCFDDRKNKRLAMAYLVILRDSFIRAEGREPSAMEMRRMWQRGPR